MQDQKKVGPNLKDVRLKLRKEWIPEWLKDPQAFRPGTKMPTFWYLSGKEDANKGNIVPASMQDEERKAISAYLWQSAYEGRVQTQQPGDARHGEELFKTRGCMACHSIGEGEQKVGGDVRREPDEGRAEVELRLHRPLGAQPARALGALLPEGEARPDAGGLREERQALRPSTPSSTRAARTTARSFRCRT